MCRSGHLQGTLGITADLQEDYFQVSLLGRFSPSGLGYVGYAQNKHVRPLCLPTTPKRQQMFHFSDIDTSRYIRSRLPNYRLHLYLWNARW